MASPGALRPSYGRLLQTKPLFSTFSLARTQAAASFSTSAPLCKRKNKPKKTYRDNNPDRGVSSLYRSGPREPLSMSNIPLPRPRDFKPRVEVDESHGLWGFFPAPNKLLLTPEESEKHGRAWKVEELRKKSWEDLHSLWWVCCRERNMLATSMTELERSEIGFGKKELEVRDEEVRKTMGAIRHALTERYYTWEDAVEAAKSDPEIDLEGGEGQVYTPSAYEDDYQSTESWEGLEETDGRSAEAPTGEGAKPGSNTEKHTS